MVKAGRLTVDTRRECHNIPFLRACIKTADIGMLIAASGLTMVRFLAEFTLSQMRFLAEFTLSEAEGLGMTEGRRARNDKWGQRF